MKKQKTEKPLDLTTALDNFSRGIMKMEYTSKRQRNILLNQWEARRSSRALYFYLHTKTTTRIENYYTLKEAMIKSSDKYVFNLEALAGLLKEVEKERVWRVGYPFSR